MLFVDISKVEVRITRNDLSGVADGWNNLNDGGTIE
jgi:hypothetical protein